MAKEPRDENDPAGLRRFARRIAQMKWWREETEAEQSEQTLEPTSRQPQEQQQGEAANNQESAFQVGPKPCPMASERVRT